MNVIVTRISFHYMPARVSHHGTRPAWPEGKPTREMSLGYPAISVLSDGLQIGWPKLSNCCQVLVFSFHWQDFKDCLGVKTGSDVDKKCCYKEGWNLLTRTHQKAKIPYVLAQVFMAPWHELVSHPGCISTYHFQDKLWFTRTLTGIKRFLKMNGKKKKTVNVASWRYAGLHEL